MLDGETRHAMQLKVSATRELVKGGGGNRSCLHVELDDGGAGWIKYETGDHVGIYPENEAGKVAELAAHIATDLDAWIRCKFPPVHGSHRPCQSQPKCGNFGGEGSNIYTTQQCSGANSFANMYGAAWREKMGSRRFLAHALFGRHSPAIWTLLLSQARIP